MIDGLFADHRLMLVHKHPVSARLGFVRFPDGGVCGFSPLPEGASIIPLTRGSVVSLANGLVTEAARRLGVACSALRLEPHFAADALFGDTCIHIRLACFTMIDPPVALAETLGCSFVDLVAARTMSPINRALMREAYETVLGS